MSDDTGKYDQNSKINKKLQSYYFNNVNNHDVNFSKPVSKKTNRNSMIHIDPEELPEVESTSLGIDLSNLDSIITSDVQDLFSSTWKESETSLNLDFDNLTLNTPTDITVNKEINEKENSISLENTLADMIRKAYDQNSFILSSKGNFVCFFCKAEASIGCPKDCKNRNTMRQMQQDFVYLKELWESAEYMLPRNEMEENFKEFCEEYEKSSEKDLYVEFMNLKIIDCIRNNQDNLQAIEDAYKSSEPKYESDTLIGFSRLNKFEFLDITNRQANALANAFKNTQPENFSKESSKELEIIYEIIRLICIFTSKEFIEAN
ncbi:hypothetical protein BCR36DRAFT_353529 [Piromyces finnis]|uniref:Uncharacterized protein n=1 Tax=Piromyces finnis TaxID=1754191 RepID=A0A1Y1V8H7_9FUNG|nr:hypothetical protein BCR36DRAFT_353529 [Piromyces finnis]|eukprot:ORX49757.1 hypothetical protein BCR36DRAFT_353529 [Piromyces finnis]